MLPGNVSRGKRAAQVGASILSCFFMAGLVFGFAALKPILLDSGVYSNFCKTDERTCKAQDTRLNLLFTVASSVTNVSALPLGALLDRVGPRWSSIFGAMVFGAGCIAFSLGIVKDYADTYLIGFALMALGSPAMFLAQFHLSNAFPSRSGLVLGAITGAFDASSLPLVFFKLGYFANEGQPSIRTFFLGYCIIPALLVVQQLTFGPSEVYERLAPPSLTTTPPTPDVDVEPPIRSRRMSSSFSRISYGVHDDADHEEIKLALGGKHQEGIVGALFGKSVKEQIGSTWFWAMEFMVVIQMTRINWYLATVNSQLVYYTGQEELADSLTNAFIFLLPLGGLISIPAIGWLLDTRPMRDVIFILGIMGVLFGSLTLTSTIVPQLIGIGVLVIARPLFYTAISDYAAKVFGFETFGTVYGLAMTLSGLFGLLLTPMDVLTKDVLNGNFSPINIVLMVLGLLSAAGLYLRVWSYTRQGTIALREDTEPGVSAISQAIVEEEEDEE